MDDPSTDTNQSLLAQVRPVDDQVLLIAGEAGSHCVKATTLDILASLPADTRPVALRFRTIGIDEYRIDRKN